MTTISSFAIADGAWIFVAMFAASWLAIAYGYYTWRGSTINQRPHGSVYSNAPAGPDSASIGLRGDRARR